MIEGDVSVNSNFIPRLNGIGHWLWIVAENPIKWKLM
uniref:3-ketodihydrosphingosine reductase isoform 2 n=1 Tax=Potamotrygon motoro TaxID=86373 RepID=A0A5J6SD98_POTMO|nr:3-ketodihydrosphingosine reductase isoform 2 [Potamotrygon motoro]